MTAIPGRKKKSPPTDIASFKGFSTFCIDHIIHLYCIPGDRSGTAITEFYFVSDAVTNAEVLTCPKTVNFRAGIHTLWLLLVCIKVSSDNT